MRAVIIFPTEEPTMRPCFCFAIKIKNSRLTYIVICKEQYFKIVIILPFVTFSKVLTRVCTPPTVKVAFISCPFSVGVISSFCEQAENVIAKHANAA